MALLATYTPAVQTTDYRPLFNFKPNSFDSNLKENNFYPNLPINQWVNSKKINRYSIA